MHADHLAASSHNFNLTCNLFPITVTDQVCLKGEPTVMGQILQQKMLWRLPNIHTASGCIFQPSPKGTEREVHKEPWLFSAGQPVVSAPGHSGRVGVFSGNVVRSDCKLRGGVSILHLINFIQIFTCLIIKKVFILRYPSHYASETKKTFIFN